MKNDEVHIQELKLVAQSVHENIWGRFMGADNVMLDYVGHLGEVHLPTAEECAQNQPNALAWWTPIENGGFFNGVYLLGQLKHYQHAPSDSLREVIRKLVDGLYNLQDVSPTPGFISRGIGLDGRCHYPASSNDQNIPWIMGLWKYLQTDIPSADEKRECRDRLYRHLKALEAAGWEIPGSDPAFNRGTFLHIDGLEGSLSSVHLLIVSTILDELSGDETRSLYKQHLNEPLSNGKTRLQIISEGFSMFKPAHSWFVATSQYAIRELIACERDLERKSAFTRGFLSTVHLATDAIACFKDYQPSQPYPFTPDWRVMMSEWKEQASCKEAEAVALREIAIWDKACPAIKIEKSTLMYSAAAAWIVAMSGDENIIQSALPEIIQALKHFDYDKLHYAAMFYAENVVYELL